MEPVRVKLYGLVARTRRAYLTYSVFEALCLVAFLSFWLLEWTRYRAVLRPLKEQTPFARFYIRVMDAVPWIVGALVVYKAAELWVVLRRFAAKEAERRRKQPARPVNAGSG